MQIVIDIPNKDIPKHQEVIDMPLHFMDGKVCEVGGYKFVELPKGHGKLVDISKIDKDRIESDNPIIYLTINGQYTEAISLDYLNNLPSIIEADNIKSEE